MKNKKVQDHLHVEFYLGKIKNEYIFKICDCSIEQKFIYPFSFMKGTGTDSFLFYNKSQNIYTDTSAYLVSDYQNRKRASRFTMIRITKRDSGNQFKFIFSNEEASLFAAGLKRMLEYLTECGVDVTANIEVSKPKFDYFDIYNNIGKNYKKIKNHCSIKIYLAAPKWFNKQIQGQYIYIQDNTNTILYCGVFGLRSLELDMLGGMRYSEKNQVREYNVLQHIYMYLYGACGSPIDKAIYKYTNSYDIPIPLPLICYSNGKVVANPRNGCIYTQNRSCMKMDTFDIQNSLYEDRAPQYNILNFWFNPSMILYNNNLWVKPNTNTYKKFKSKAVAVYTTKPKITKETKQPISFYKSTANIIKESVEKVACGIEFECPVLSVAIPPRVFKKHCHPDGGGMEVKTTILEAKWMALFQKLHIFTKKLREDKKYKRNIRGSCHLHLSYRDSTEDPISRKHLVEKTAHNIAAICTDTAFGLYFFDIGHPLYRRPSDYGFGYKPGRLGKTIIYTKIEKRLHERWTNYSPSGRSSLFRRISLNANGFHFEYRGSDFLSSALLLGLKVELMKAIIKYSSSLANEDTILYVYSNNLNAVLKSINNANYPSELSDTISRKQALKLIKKLRAFMPKEVYNGLYAWVTYNNSIDINYGLSDWYTDIESIIISEMGVGIFTNLIKSKKFRKNLTDTRSIYSSWASPTTPISGIKRCSTCVICGNIQNAEDTSEFGGISICRTCANLEKQNNKKGFKSKEYKKKISAKRKKLITEVLSDA